MKSSDPSGQPGPDPQGRRGAIPLMAAACGIMVANVYLGQPLLAGIAHDLAISENAASLVAVAAQLGYALGILFMVPLADVADPRRLIRVLIVLTTIGLLGAAAAPGLATLALASGAIATFTVVPQVLIPLGSLLVPPGRRGRAIGSLHTGLVLGILLSRTVSGTVAQLAGSWRASYLLAAIATASLLVILPPFLPERSEAQPSHGYATLLRSLPPLLRLPALRLSMTLGFCVFAAFSAIWATLAFHLAGPPFGLGLAATGLFGLWGAPGAILAPMAGRLSDRFGSDAINLVGILAVAAAIGTAALVGGHSLLALVLVVNLLDFGLQGGQVANQTRIFALGDSNRGRTNTLYMVSVFSGGACGSLLGSLAWTAAGWLGVCVLAGVFVSLAALTLLASRLLRTGSTAI